MSARAAWRLEGLGFRQVFRYAAGKSDWLAAGLPSEGTLAVQLRAGAVARKNVPTCRLTDRIGDVRERVQVAEERVCIVVNNQGIVLRRLQGQALEADAQATVEEVMEEGPTTIRPNIPLESIAKRMDERRVGSIIVTDSDGRLIGILYRRDADRRLEELQACGTSGA